MTNTHEHLTIAWCSPVYSVYFSMRLKRRLCWDMFHVCELRMRFHSNKRFHPSWRWLRSCCYIFIYIYFGRLHQGNFDGKNMINDSYYGSLNILCTRYTMLFASSDQYCVVVVVVLDGAPDKNQLFWVRKKKGCLGFEHILLLLIVEWLW